MPARKHTAPLPLPTSPWLSTTRDEQWVASQYYPTTPDALWLDFVDEMTPRHFCHKLKWDMRLVPGWVPPPPPPVAMATRAMAVLEVAPLVVAEPVIDLTLDDKYDVIDLTLDDKYDKVDVIDLTLDDKYDKVDVMGLVASGRKRCRAAMEHGTSVLRHVERVYKQAKRLIGGA